MTTAQHFNETVWVKLAPSAVHGIGVFAIRDIPKGTKICDDCPRCWDVPFSMKMAMFTDAEVEQLHPAVKAFVFSMWKKRGDETPIWSPNAAFYPQVFMNHSETPNCDGRVTLHDIAAGEELLENYETI